VPECNQALLLQGGFHLEEQRALSHYWDHLQHGYVFLFDRNSLRPSALNSATSTSTSVSTSRSSALPVYERARADAERALERALEMGRQSAAERPHHRLRSLHGAHHLSLANDSSHWTGKEKLVDLLHRNPSTVVDELCKDGHRWSAEQRLQLLALCTAVESLSLHTRPVFDDFNRLWHHYEAQRRRHSSLLASFDADLFRLHDHRVPAQLATSTAASPSPPSSSSAGSGSRRGAAGSAEPASAPTGGATLYDCVSAEALQEWATKCRVRHQQLIGKASRIQQAVQELRTGKQQENQPPEFNEAELKSWRAELVACKQHTAEVVSEAYQRLHDQEPNWRRTAYHSLEEWASKAFETLENNRKKSAELLVPILTSKYRFTDYLHGRLRHISLLQSRVRQVSEKLVIFREDIIFQKDTFHQLSIVKGMPTAFCAAQEETARRRQWSAQVQKGVCVCVCVRTRV
jgi:hypothetical protein